MHGDSDKRYPGSRAIPPDATNRNGFLDLQPLSVRQLCSTELCPLTNKQRSSQFVELPHHFHSDGRETYHGYNNRKL
jgi:hypothetical protein